MRATYQRAAGALCLLLATGLVAQVPAGYVTVSGSHVGDATGALVQSATIAFAPVNNAGQAISFKVGGAGGQVISAPVSTTVTNGVFSIQLADTALTSPVNVCYKATIVDNVTGNNLLGPGYTCVQPAASGGAVTGPQAWCTSAGACNWDNYTPNLAGLVTVQTGPQGPPGATGATGPQGPAGTAAAAGATGAVQFANSSNQMAADPANFNYNSVTHILNASAVAASTVAVGGIPLAGDVTYTGLNVYGDSFGAGYGATVHNTYGYAYLLQKDFGGTFNNQSISGARIPDLIAHSFNAAAPSYTLTTASVVELGQNDSACGVTTGCEANFTHSMRALIAYRAIPLQYQIQFGSATPAGTCTTTGTWTADNTTFAGFTPLAGLALMSVVSGSTITCSVLSPSPYLYLGWYARDGFTSSASVSINSGAVTDTLNAFGFNGQVIQSALGTTQTVFANRYFVSGGITTFTVTVNTAGAGNQFSLYFAGSPMPRTPTAMANFTEGPPRVFVTGVGYLPGYTTPDSSMAAYDTLVYNLATQFAADGFFVNYINLRNPTNISGLSNGPLNNTTDYAGGTLANGQTCPATADVYHPNNCGHQHIRDAIVAVARPLSGSSSGGSGPASLSLRQVQVSADYTLQPGVDGIVYQNCNACTVTLPNALPTSGPIWIVNDGTNSFTIAAASGAVKTASVPSAMTPNTGIGVVGLLSGGVDYWSGFTQAFPVSNPFTLGSAACSYMQTATTTGTAQSFLAGSGPGQYIAVNRNACTGVFGDTAKTAAYMQLNATAGGTTSNVQFATSATANSTPGVTHTFDNTGINLPTGEAYKVNGAAGVTKTCSTAITAMTVVGGIITSLTCP